ncbi:MAG: hypothetical protein JRF63_10130, partial [Deltaproteobacteria bacterium]|nr:hypothetical protein [Deltaproteobacteria bacterium]
GLFIHTNHLVFDSMKDEVQDAEYVSSSSTTRWDLLSRWKAGVTDPSSLTVDQLLEQLAMHEGKPYSPCRHPEGDVHGFTLGTAVFEAPAGSFRLYKGQPCQQLFKDYEQPA